MTADRLCTVSGCQEPRQRPRSLCRAHWYARRRELDQSEARRERIAQYRSSEARRAAQRRYRQAHRATVYAANRRWRERHRDELLARRRAAYAALRAAGLSSYEAAGRR